MRGAWGEVSLGNLLEQVMTFAPRLADVGGLTATTSGYYGTTPDANPLIGIDTNLDNLVHAAGFSGHGLMHALGMGRGLAELILRGGYETIDLSRFGYSRVLHGAGVPERGVR